MHYPSTRETYHVYSTTDSLPTVCENLQIALQHMSTFPAGTIAHVEKVVETHTIHQIYGTATNPLPSPPNASIPTQSNQITHIKKG